MFTLKEGGGRETKTNREREKGKDAHVCAVMLTKYQLRLHERKRGSVKIKVLEFEDISLNLRRSLPTQKAV